MTILFWSILLSIVIGFVAAIKGRSFIGFLFLSLLFSPIIGFIIVLIVPRIEENIIGNKKCPKCAEWIKQKAIICKHCGNEISIIEKEKSKDKLSERKCQKCGEFLRIGRAICDKCNYINVDGVRLKDLKKEKKNAEEKLFDQIENLKNSKLIKKLKK